MEFPDANAGRTAVRGARPTLEALRKVLEAIAGDLRIPPNFAEWIRDTLRCNRRKIRILRYVLAYTPEYQMSRLLDVGSQFVKDCSELVAMRYRGPYSIGRS